MHQWLRSHLTYANVVATLALFVALGGGTALASYVIASNKQVGPGTIAGHKPPSGDHSNIIAGSITGKDIADRSGVDTCQQPLLKKFGPICAGSDGVSRDWNNAVVYCASFGLRLPSSSEAVAMAKNFDVPGVISGDAFWTDDEMISNNVLDAAEVDENGSVGVGGTSVTNKTVCVTDPSA
jgi:hypothetical protein